MANDCSHCACHILIEKIDIAKPSLPLVFANLLFPRTLAVLAAGVLWGHSCLTFNQEAIECAFGFLFDTLKPALVAHLNLKNPQATTRYRCGYQLMPSSLVAIRRARKDVVL